MHSRAAGLTALAALMAEYEAARGCRRRTFPL